MMIATSLIIFECYTISMNEKKKDIEHEHFANDDPTEFDKDKLQDMAKEAIKKFKSLWVYWK